jgi:glycosyltransferase involved in cell wall biosynthesis
MRIINLVSDSSLVNFGVWNAAMATASVLQTNYGVNSELWTLPNSEGTKPSNEACKHILVHNFSNSEFERIIKEQNLDPNHDIIVTHGSWTGFTKWGAWCKKMGFTWIYVPHGMFEPWALNQKKWKKWLYLNLVERPLSQKADAIRAVGRQELIDILRIYGRPGWYCSNGVSIPTQTEVINTGNEQKVLFLGRLHLKKRPTQLVEAWFESSLGQNPQYKLLLVGPDDGELANINKVLAKYTNPNVEYLGKKYGEEKNTIFRQSRFFILPSLSEGFASSILEALCFGVYPIISRFCHFPDAIKAGLATETGIEVHEIVQTLNQIPYMPKSTLDLVKAEGTQFIETHYSDQAVAKRQFEAYSRLLNKRPLIDI